MTVTDNRIVNPAAEFSGIAVQRHHRAGPQGSCPASASVAINERVEMDAHCSKLPGHYPRMHEAQIKRDGVSVCVRWE